MENYGTVKAPQNDAVGQSPATVPAPSGTGLPPCESTPLSGRSSPEPARTPYQRLKDFYERNIGLLFVLMGQFFASIVSGTRQL